MIESLHIEDLGVIEETDLALSPGLNALTGETGAGKTMVLTSLGLLLGERAESTVVRAGAQRALVEGAFTLDPASRAATRAVEAGAELDEDLLLASRTVPLSGRSRAHLGGRSVPSTVLSEVGNRLVSVHGQADQLRLRSSAAQRAALDSLGGPEHAALCRSYAQAYRARREAQDALDTWRAGTEQRAAETARLRGWLEAVEALAPSPGEDAELTAEADRLDHAEDLRRAATTARDALVGDEDAVGDAPDVSVLVAAVDRAMATVLGVDPVLTEMAGRVHQIGVLAADVASELSSYLTSLEADPARLAWVQNRRGALSRALREIGDPSDPLEDVDALLAFSQRCAQRLAELDGPQDAAGALVEALEAADTRLARLAADLTQARQHLAAWLEEAVTSELEGLQMKGARLVVDLAPLEEPGPTGSEGVTLQLVSHPGAPALALGKGASGGELSRIMLALEVVLADAVEPAGQEAGQEVSQDTDREASRYPRTFVFDEIDAGVGGRAAREIGRRLARLAQRHQVVVVTHLAQVAAWADNQLVVRKETEALAQSPGAAAVAARGEDTGTSLPRTRTRVMAVTGAEREKELARMLSGHEDSDTALRHAAELLEEARVAQSQA